MSDEVFESRIKVQQIVQNQLPEFVIDEFPKVVDFLKQYYISQEFQGGPTDISENLDQYLKLDNLTPEVIVGFTLLDQDVSNDDDTIRVNSTRGFPKEYGLLQIDDEIITYTGITTNTFTGCVRGFSGITDYRTPTDPSELIFSSSNSASHTSQTKVVNLSSLFLKEFYRKIKFTFTPGLEDTDFVSDLNVNNFIKEARTLYQSKGTEESFKILFKALYNEVPKVIDLEQYLIKPSSSEYVRREILFVEKISGDPLKLVGQTIRRSKDPFSQASISEVEVLTRNNKTYYKLSLFIGFNDKEFIEGQFQITGKSKILENVEAGDDVITVDSTVGFENSGILVIKTEDNVNTVTYTEKTLNQFLGCQGVETEIPLATTVYSDETIYGYENGDLTKKVELRISGVLSNFVPIDDNIFASESDIIYNKGLGSYIENPQLNPSYKEIFANSWIYNTSCRYQLKNFKQPTNELDLKVESDESSLDVNDYIDIIERSSGEVKNLSQVLVTSISLDKKRITITPAFTPEEFPGSPGKYKDYDIRRKIKKASSKNVPIRYGNNKLISNVQNLYDDNSAYGYISATGLPEYETQVGLITAFSPNSINLVDFIGSSQSYSTIRFTNFNVPFLSGDEVVYECENVNSPIIGLESGKPYYVQVIFPDKIRLFTSRSSVETDSFILLRYPNVSSGEHRFILAKDSSKTITIKKNLKKFPISQNLSNSALDQTAPGPIGMLVNGVEIISPKSLDKIYYGPIKTISVLNSGEGYDVVNPPGIVVSNPGNGGTQSLIQPVVRGVVENVIVDPQNFDIEGDVYVTITGGNGSGAVLKPIVSKRSREIEFDGRITLDGGGVNIQNETITFFTNHNLSDGEIIIYDSNGNDPIGIGTYFGSNSVLSKTLSNNSQYYIQKIDNSKIKLYNSFSDYNSGINTVGFTTENTFGIHKFKTLEKNTLSDIKVIRSGSGYENKKLYVKTSGISTTTDSVYFENHTFNDGDVVEYSYALSGTPISGLSTQTQYKIIKLDDNNFRLANAGIGGTDNSNYVKQKYENLSTTGTGLQIFKYPDITVSVIGPSLSESAEIVATPVVRGTIVNAFLYESGTGYGSSIVNYEKKPIVKVTSGKDAEVFPIVRNGKIVDVNVSFGGYEYYSPPSLKVIGSGFGALLRAVVENQRIVDVIVIKSGSGYDNNTKIAVYPTGKNAAVDIKIRDLTLNDRDRYKNDEVLISFNNYLKYGIISYNRQLFSSYLKVVENEYSPIIGWAYDGNPIYGPYAPSNPNNLNSPLKLMETGYVLDKTNVFDRPNVSDDIVFIEDYVFNNSGDLDEHNGRFAKTLEFPNGVYAYYATIDDYNLQPKYPYFIGNTYRSPILEDNLLPEKDFDLNKSSLTRNTFPYCLNKPFTINDFIDDANKFTRQLATVESILTGSIDSVEIISSGDGYKVGDELVFDESESGGGGVKCKVSEILGKEIVSIASSSLSYDNCVLVWNNNNVKLKTPTSFDLLSGEFVSISGVTTYLRNVSGSHKIEVISETSKLLVGIPTGSVGLVTDIYLSYIPEYITSDDLISIEDETLPILNVFSEDSIVRVKRASIDHYPRQTEVTFVPNTLSLPIKTDYFDSKVNDKVYFNPKFAVGVGTTSGIGLSTSFNVGITTRTVDIETQSIYLPNHPFVTGQEVLFTKVSSIGSTISVANTESSTQFTLPLNPANDTEIVYVINKSKDYIGITTLVGLTTNTKGLFFINNGLNSYEYSFESQYPQIKSNIVRTKATVAVSTDHNLSVDEVVKLNVVSNLSTGIGSSDKVRVIYNSDYGKILLNPVGFTSTTINKNTDKISINSHGFKTGDKVFYDVTAGQVASGLSTGSYYVYKIDDSTIQLGETLYDVSLDYPNIVAITSEGGNNHRLSLINPEISVIKNSQLVFDLSDSSVSDYNLKIFYDSSFYSDFLSVSDSEDFNVVSIGSSVIINYSDNIPSNLYYTLVNDEQIIKPDYDVKNYSKISYKESFYNGSYSIIGIGSTTFDVCLENVPENSLYTQDETSILEYSTKSLASTGPINSVILTSRGNNYKKIPLFVTIDSESGTGGNVILKSNTVGKINKIRLSEQIFNYPSDKTLNPSVQVSPILIIKDSNTISEIEVLNGGNNYTNPPSLLIYDEKNNIVVDTNSLYCNVTSGSINSVEFNKRPYGIKDCAHRIIAVNNSNGITIDAVNKVNDTTFDIILSTPILGYNADIFSSGDLVFVEGINTQVDEEGALTGTGFNSSDYKYVFFEVDSFTNSIPAKVRINLSQLTDNVGTVDSVDISAVLVNKNNYPEFSITHVKSEFNSGEQLLVNTSQQDLFVAKSNTKFIEITGNYVPEIGDILTGKNSGVVATVQDIILNKGKFEIDYYNKKNYGWNNDTGKLNEAFQVCPDNDYYQNLSYSVKSTIQYSEMVDPVNRLLHTSGLKNFADTEVVSKITVGIGFTSSDTAVLDIFEQKRVDTLYNFDLGLDVNPSSNKSRFIKLQNKKISDYFKCLSNKVLVIDDISPFFDDNETNQTLISQQFSEIGILEENYTRYLVQINNPETNDVELTEIIAILKDDEAFILEKGSLSSVDDRFGSFNAVINESGENVIRFIPSDIYDSDYNLKILETSFSNAVFAEEEFSVGFTTIVSYKNTVSIGQTYELASFDKNSHKSYVAQVHIKNISENSHNYVEVFASHYNNEVSYAEYYFDTNSSSSTNFIGEFQPTIDSNNFILNYYNSEDSNVIVTAKIIGFGSTAVGIAGTYRFNNDDQADGDERTILLQSNYASGSSTIDVISIDKDKFTSAKSFIQVSFGQTSALHQTMVVYDNNNSYNLQYPFVSVGSTSGIGTFGSEISGSNIVLKFFVDPGISSPVSIQSYSEIFYKEIDIVNQPNELRYGALSENVLISFFDALNGDRIDEYAFELDHNSNPIFLKTFDPKKVLNLSTGVFSIKDHYFSTGEKAFYRDGTSIGISSSIKINPSYTLPSEVYIYSIDQDNFGISTTRSNALAGIYVTFTSYGNGNRHEIEMEKKNEKSIITIDGIVQQPLTYTPIVYNLTDNGGTVSASSTYFSTTGISTVSSGDILKIGDEYAKIISVGFGTTSVGPINETGSFSLMNVERGFFNSISTSHSDGDQFRIYKGSYNILKNKVHFVNPPRGGGRESTNQSSLPFPSAYFSGRVFLQSDYEENKIYDDISSNFSGIGRTFTLTSESQNISGIDTGNGFVFINGVFQPPLTENNSGTDNDFNSFEIITNQISGISSVSFTGIKTSTESNPIIIDYDINRNELPRGGIVVSLGSTSGLGFAPLVGASVTAVVSSGSITAVGIGSTDLLGSGYNGQVSVAVTDTTGYGANITANIGIGGTLSFTVVNGGSNYSTNTRVIVSPPSYQNLDTVGVYRVGIGSTTVTGEDLRVNLVVGASSTTGIGSGYYEVQSFTISNVGYNYRVGDIIKPVGLVTDARLASPLIECEFVVTEIFTDSFYGMQIGEFDYFDSIKSSQDSVRRSFPLLYNGEVRSIEINNEDSYSSSINLNASLLVFVNGVIQEPGQSYTFDGGTRITFEVAPKVEDEVFIFFYQGKRGVDVIEQNVNETVKEGDELQLLKNDLYEDIVSQTSRIINNIKSSDEVETNLYTGLGVDAFTYRPISWTKQKVDKVLSGRNVYKSRDSLEPLVFPTANIIKNLSTNDSRIFVDNVELFRLDNPDSLSGIILPTENVSVVSAAFTATVGSGGTISEVTITNPGFGYTETTLDLKFAPPSVRGIGIGTTSAAGTVTIINGSVTAVSISSAGSGYSSEFPPQVIISSPLSRNYELLSGISSIKGFSGSVIGINTISIGSSNAIIFDILVEDQYENWISTLVRGYPILVSETSIGNPRSSLDVNTLSVVGVGTTFLDNIYVVHSISGVGIKTASVLSYINSGVTGVSTYTLNGVGRFSWGVLDSVTRNSNPVQLSVDGFTVTSGLSTFPVIQRRSSGLRNTGSVGFAKS